MKIVRSRLGWKLFFSYLVIILVGVVTLAIAADLHAPSALSRHLATMQMSMGGALDGMTADLLENFQTAITEVLFVAAAAAMATAVLVSTFVTRRIVRPIQQMKVASRRIADGRYDERVKVAGDDELAELARSFNQMAHTLAQTEERRRQLLGDVAHELRTPLSSIKSLMEGLQDGVLPAEAATFADVEREVSRLQRLVHDLEELSRAEAGQIPLELAQVDPGSFIHGAAERLRRQFDDKGVALHVAVAPNLPTVAVDTARLTQVMINLLGNALQYTPEGGRVAVTARADGPRVVVAVQDTGLGLTAEQMAHVFERFYRVDKSRSRAGGGNGIGLTISRHLAEAHGGQISVASAGLGQGSTFTLTLVAAGEPSGAAGA